MDQELHVVPYDMIFFFVFLKTVLLTVENVSLDAADETKWVFIFLEAFFLFTNLSKFIDDYGTDDLVHYDLYYEEVTEVYEDVPKTNCGVVVGEVIWVVQTDKTSIGLEAYAQREDKTVVESSTVSRKITPASIVEVKNGGQNECQNEVDE